MLEYCLYGNCEGLQGKKGDAKECKEKRKALQEIAERRGL